MCNEKSSSEEVTLNFLLLETKFKKLQMKSLSNFQFFPIINDRVFEEFVCDIFNNVDKTNSYELFGRKGQNQHGMDIYSFEKATVIQCKHKLITRLDQKVREELLSDFSNELDRFKSYNEEMGGHFKKFIIASTYKNDAHLATQCNRLSIQHNIVLEYWSWERLTRYIQGDIFDKYYEFFRNSIEVYYRNTTSSNPLIPIDKQQPLVKQVYDFLSTRFKDITILHSRMFLNENVFERKLNDYSRRSVFKYTSYNEDFYKLFADLEFKNNKLVDNFSQDRSQFEMMDFITRTLSENGIKTILGNKYGQVKKITNIVKKPDDYFDDFEKFKFIDAFKALPLYSEGSSLNEILRQGYFYYKMGDLLTAKKIFQNASIKAQAEDRKITYFITQHNLLHLGTFIEWGYYKLPEKNEIIKELKNISLDEIEVDAIDIKIKETIARSSFFTSAKESIQSYSDKVDEFYYGHLRGVRSSSNFEDELHYEYSTLHSFISKNYIVYDDYSDYKQIINNLFKSMLASYSIRNGRNKIENLNDFYLYHFIEYGDKKEFEKYLKRYNLYEIEYQKYENQDYHFIKLFSNFANNSTAELSVILEGIEEYFASNFKERFNKIFRNFVFFSGILKLETVDVSAVTENIFKILENKTLLERFNSWSVYDFFIRKNMQISNCELVRFVFYTVENEGFYDSNKLIALFDELHYNKISLELTDIQFRSLVEHLDPEKYDNSNGSHLIITFYALLAPDHKQYLKEILLEKLDKKFDAELCSMMLVYDLIDCDDKGYFDFLVASIDITTEIVEPGGLGTDEDSDAKRYAVLDGIFNVIFKYNLSLSDSRFVKFVGISNYYDWLLDIDSFDYSKFNPYWIDGYGSKYYYSYMKKHEQVLKREVQKHIIKNHDERLKKIFYTIFCYEEF